MSASELAWRSAHDLGLAGWFGSSLARPQPRGSSNGTGAPSDLDENAGDTSVKESKKKKEHTSEESIAPQGWGPPGSPPWAPVMLGSMAMHLAGGAGLLAWNASRLAGQRGVLTSTVAKSVATVAAVGLTLVAWRDQLAFDDLSRQDPSGPDDERRRRSLERRRAVAGWLLPLTTGTIVILGALEGEQQRPRETARGFLANLPGVTP